jgi:solute carrier family 35 (UDP-sugar transporter), member A1/2/3
MSTKSAVSDFVPISHRTKIGKLHLCSLSLTATINGGPSLKDHRPTELSVFHDEIVIAAMTAPPALDKWALFFMALLAVQFAFQPLLTRQYTPQNICRSTVILMQELLKFILAFFMLTVSGSTKSALLGWTVGTWATVAFIPAALYALQNIAALEAYQNLDTLTFNVLNQTKTLSAALCCYLVMGRKQSFMQVLSLLLLLLSALIMERLVPLDVFATRGIPIEIPELGSRHWTHGVAPIMVASVISGLSGALSQKNLEAQGGGRNPYLFSMELCAASSLILFASLLASPDGKMIARDGFWNGWTASTWIPILSNSIGGIIVGLVTKYAGSVRKGFALIFGMFLSGVVQALVTDEGVSVEQGVGGLLAAVSLWMHSTHPHVPKEKVE